jgi:hypothetical protein
VKAVAPTAIIPMTVKMNCEISDRRVRLMTPMGGLGHAVIRIFPQKK